MRYLTPRKRAEVKGAAHAGTEHHWSMMVSAVGLAFLVPVWLYVFGRTLGQPREGVLETFSHPAECKDLVADAPSPSRKYGQRE